MEKLAEAREQKRLQKLADEERYRKLAGRLLVSDEEQRLRIERLGAE